LAQSFATRALPGTPSSMRHPAPHAVNAASPLRQPVPPPLARGGPCSKGPKRLLAASLCPPRCAVAVAVAAPLARRLQRTRARRAGGAAPAEGNAWFTDSGAELDRALRRIEKEWIALRALADAEPPDGQHAEESSDGWLARRIACLLVSSSLDLIRPFATPFESADAFPPLPGSDLAAAALLGKDFHLFVNYATSPGFEQLSKAGLAFWQATFFLRSLHESAGEASAQETAEALKGAVEAQDALLTASLRSSRLIARQNYLTAASFGYFLRRCQQRLRLERSFSGSKVPECSAFTDLEGYIATLSPETAVELVRTATRAGSAALERRATTLFGGEEELLEELREGPHAVAQLRCSHESRQLLDFEAAAFGAALFEAEEVAARWCDLQYTAVGSRGGLGGFLLE